MCRLGDEVDVLVNPGGPAVFYYEYPPDDPLQQVLFHLTDYSPSRNVCALVHIQDSLVRPLLTNYVPVWLAVALYCVVGPSSVSAIRTVTHTCNFHTTQDLCLVPQLKRWGRRCQYLQEPGATKRIVVCGM